MTRIQDRAQAVAQQVVADGRQGQRQTGKRRQPPGVAQVSASLLDHGSQADQRFLGAESQVAQEGFQQDDVADAQGGRDDQGRQHAGQDMSPGHRDRMQPQAAGGGHEIPLLQAQDLRPDEAVGLLLGAPSLPPGLQVVQAFQVGEDRTRVVLADAEGHPLRVLDLDADARLHRFEVRAPSGATLWSASLGGHAPVAGTSLAHRVALESRDGARAVVSLSGVELMDFEPVGTLEAFYTDGLRTLLRTTRARTLREKTLRYPGHAERMRMLRESGFFDRTPLRVGNLAVAPRAVTEALLFRAWALPEGDEEFTVLRVTATGRKGGRAASLR